MKAAVIDRYGGNERVQVKDIAVPVMGPVDLLVRVHAASVHPLDAKTRDEPDHRVRNESFDQVRDN